MSRPLTIAIGQLTGQPLAAAQNLALTLDWAGEAFRQGARLVVLPELIIQGYVLDRDGLARTAQPIDGPAVQAWQGLAEQFDGYIAGGFAERAEGGLFNTAVLVGPKGLVLHYRKLHLFDAEKTIFMPGNRGLPVADTPIGRCGLCVCYDLRFVEVARLLALRGAELVLVPTAWVMGFDRSAWDQEGYCPQARGAALQANLNQTFIACASQAGTAGDLQFLGSSLIADPFGRSALGPMSGSESGVELQQIDLDEVARAQSRGPLINPRADRRTDVYGLWDGVSAL